jgi:hypothetical protein
MIVTIVIIKNRNNVMNVNRYRYSSRPDTNVRSRKHRNIRKSNSPLCTDVHMETSFFLRDTIQNTESDVYRNIRKAIIYLDNSIT